MRGLVSKSAESLATINWEIFEESRDEKGLVLGDRARGPRLRRLQPNNDPTCGRKKNFLRASLRTKME
jgi:hypothetical protein